VENVVERPWDTPVNPPLVGPRAVWLK